jgi:hypothetical protein
MTATTGRRGPGASGTWVAERAALASRPNEPSFPIFDYGSVTELTGQPLEQSGSARRATCERVPEVDTWLDIRHPYFEL